MRENRVGDLGVGQCQHERRVQASYVESPPWSGEPEAEAEAFRGKAVCGAQPVNRELHSPRRNSDGINYRGRAVYPEGRKKKIE